MFHLILRRSSKFSSAHVNMRCLASQLVPGLRAYSSEGMSGEVCSLDSKEVSKFHFAADWWSEKGSAAALHTLNHLRVPFIRDGLVGDACETDPRPLTGLQLLDVGSGGGILSEALGRLGATVTGIDPIEDNVALATQHVMCDADLAMRVSYRCCAVEDIEYAECYDGVVCSEVIEHVNSQQEFIGTCANLVKPGGSIFFTTINKTSLSYALAVLAAEYVLRIVPPGTHDWEKFISPGEIQDTLRDYDMDTRLVHGMTINPLTRRWSWIKDTNINYVLHAVKHKD